MERVPESGRWRRISITPEAEAKLGEDAYNSVISQSKNDILPEDHPVTRHVRRIVASILEANSLGSVVDAEKDVVGQPASNDKNGEVSKMKRKEWHLAVIGNERIMNTTANSGGIIVFTGLLHVCKDEHGLAAILGHEIAHVVARHTAERYTKAKDNILFPLRFISRKDRDPWNFNQIMSTSLHEQELEADKIGLRLSARACFNPQAAIEVNQRLAVLEEKLRLLHSDFKPTHPTSKERIEVRMRLHVRCMRLTSPTYVATYQPPSGSV
ncbi:hypothetical protein M0805_007638 [Coniferiporia weirii]|nr:hypothetical protein M0805_007638 [Coniferiporia weirii]